MSMKEKAIKLTKDGFYVFPIRPNSKLPAIKDFPSKATRFLPKIMEWWDENPSYNIGISTSDFAGGGALIVIDVDNKGEKKGDDEVFKLELEGKEFPSTLEQRTPTGGRHFIYSVKEPLKQGTKVFGTTSIDTRSKGGYIVGAGSVLDGCSYVSDGRPVAPAPEWIIEECGKRKVKDPLAPKAVEGVDPQRAKLRAIEYLFDAPRSVEGQGGDETAFKVACRVKDCGVDEHTAFILMSGQWNDECDPCWSFEDLRKKIANAYAYGLEPIGSSALEAQFPPLEPNSAEPETTGPLEEEKDHPFHELNKAYAYIGGSRGIVIHETRDPKGAFHLEHIPVPIFHQNLAADTMIYSGKTVPVSKEWIRDPRRRSYQGFCFRPGSTDTPRFYNLWRGFSVDPATDTQPSASFQYRALELFLEHALVNVCGGDEDLNKWLIGYFAHLVQRPGEKPLTAIVFRGKKGVGKNALIERVGYLLGKHFAVVSNRRYLTGQFNSILEDKLLLTLDEAFWSGDKAAEGVLKDLITGSHHMIERKGLEPYTVDNCLRLAILGNEDWLVPATEDERRFAVFTVGEGRKQDHKFFKDMRVGMEKGGYALLLRYLLDFDLSTVDVDRAPSTAGLVDQKIQTLDPLGQWWRESLIEGRLMGSDFAEGWSNTVPKKGIRDAYQRFAAERKMSGWNSSVVSESHFSRSLKKFSPSLLFGRNRLEGSLTPTYSFSDLDVVREEWKSYCGELIKNEDEIL